MKNTENYRDSSEMLSQQAYSNHSWQKFAATLENTLFQGLFSLFEELGHFQQSMQTQFIKQLIAKAIISCQIISLLTCSYELKYWDQFGVYWEFLLFTRLDYICYKMEVLPFCTIFTKSVVFSVSVVFFLYCYLVYRGKKIFKLIKFLLRIQIYTISKVFQIPLIILFSLQASRLIQNENTIFKNFQLNKFQEGVQHQVFAIIALIMVLFLTFMNIMGSSNLKYSTKDIDFKAQNSQILQREEFAITTFVVVWFSLDGYNHLMYLLVILTVAQVYLYYRCLLLIPKYNHLANKLQSSSNLMIGLISFGFVMGKYFENSGVILIFAILVTPSLVYLNNVWVYQKRVSKIKSPTLEEIKKIESHYEFEIKIRKLYENKNVGSDIDVINSFSTFFLKKEGQKRIVVMWESMYCYYYMRDLRLSMIKLSKRMLTPYSLESNYQIFKFKKAVNNEFYKQFQQVNFLDYLFGLERLRIHDKRVCIEFLKFFEQIDSTKRCTNKINLIQNKICLKISQIKSLFENLNSNYPDCQELIQIYFSFVRDILSEHQTADLLQQKLIGIQNQDRVLKQKYSYFFNKNAILIISGQEKNLGIITYSNQMMSEILQVPVSQIIGSELSQYIPISFTKRHNQFLKRYLLYCNSTTIDVPQETFICNEKGFLIEVFMQIRCVALTGWPFFIVMMQKIEAEREVIQIDQLGNILGVSFGVTQIFNLSGPNLIGSHCSRIFPQYAYGDLLQEQCCKIYINGNSYYLTYQIKKVVRSEIRYFNIQADWFMRSTLSKPEDYISEAFQSFNPSSQYLGDDAKKVTFYQEIEKKNEQYEIYTSTIDQKIRTTLNNSYFVREGSVSASSEQKIQRKINKKFEKKIIAYIRLIKVNIILLLLISLFLINYDSFQFFFVTRPKVIFENLNQFWQLADGFHISSNEIRNLQVQIFYQTSSLDTDLNEEILEYHISRLTQIREDLDQWILKFQDCGISNKLKDKNLPVWNTQQKEVQYKNLANYLSEYLTAINQWKLVQDSQHFQFIINNGQGLVNDHLQNLSQQVTECNVEKLQDFMTLSLQILLWTQSCIFILFLWNLFIVFKYQRNMNSQWEHILSFFDIKTNQLKNLVAQRLDSFYEYVQIEPTDNRKIQINSKSFFCSQYLFLNLKFIVPIVLNSAYCSLMVYTFVQTIDIFSIHKIYTLSIVNQQFEFITDTNFWSRESMLLDCCSLEQQFQEFLPFNQPLREFQNLQNRLSQVQKGFLNEIDWTDVSEYENQDLFQYHPNESLYIQQGFYQAVNILYIQARFHVEQGMEMEALMEFINEFSGIVEKKSGLIGSIVEISEQQTQELIFYLFYTNAFMTSFNVLVFLVLFMPFLRRISTELKSREKIFQIALKSQFN